MVYCQYSSRESDPRYCERQMVKRGIYAKYKLRLIELGDAEIERLDDVLPRELVTVGINGN